ncbi:MAG: DMT family transporter [Burkholderiaceae bacterium]
MSGRSIGFACLAITSVGWALNWPLIKLILADWPPLFARGLAGVIAAVLLGGLALARRQSLAVPRAARPRLLFASFTNVFAWMGFSTVAMKLVTVAECALIVYTMPIWAMLLAWPLSGERPTGRGIVSIILAMMGVALLLGGSGFDFDRDKLVGIGLSLASAVLFALGNVLNREPPPIPPLVDVAWQVGLGCLVMLVLGIVFERPDYTALSPVGIASFAYMVVVPMGVCYLAWFETVRRLSAVTASTGILLVPALAVVAAAAVLGEPLGIREASAVALTLGGVALALRRV